jgi:hypothetical protein
MCDEKGLAVGHLLLMLVAGWLQCGRGGVAPSGWTGPGDRSISSVTFVHCCWRVARVVTERAKQKAGFAA